MYIRRRRVQNMGGCVEGDRCYVRMCTGGVLCVCVCVCI